MNSSERTNEFSKGGSSFLTVKSRVFSWIKLLFIPSVAKRSSASELNISDNVEIKNVTKVHIEGIDYLVNISQLLVDPLQARNNSVKSKD